RLRHFHTLFSSLPLPCLPPLARLPSFPTRRSSDLVPMVALMSYIFTAALTEIIFFVSLVTVIGVPIAVMFGGLAIGTMELNQQVDRKSTRLNSSHQIISYAVFCLKKKKKRAHNSVS